MNNEYAQVHELPEGYVITDYTYDGLVPVIPLAKIAIYLVSFVAFFMLARFFFRLM